jgi:hypothetical protein
MIKACLSEGKMTDKKISNDEKKEKSNAIEEASGATIPNDDVCQKAPEWAEHARLNDEDEPCDDGRTGNLERDREK